MRNRARPGVDSQREEETPSRQDQPEAVGLLGMRDIIGNAATQRAVEEPLDPSVRGRLEGRFGAELSQVRLRRDSAAAVSAGGIAYTVGNQITVDPGRYRPGTLAGEVLIAHEVAHTLQQQQEGPGAGERALEAEADRAALATVSGRSGRFLPVLRSALTLRRCKGCTPAEESWLTTFRAEHDPERLAEMLRPRTDDELTRLSSADGGDSVHTEAVTWERAVRAREFGRLSGLSLGADAGLRRAYGRRIVAKIMEGGYTIHVGGDAAFKSFVEGTLGDLTAIPHGLKLILDLLATGQRVELNPSVPGESHTTNPVNRTGASPTTQVTDENDPNVGVPLPPDRQRRGAGSGSTITLDPTTIDNEVTLGSAGGRLMIIDQNRVATVGHELIHALHSAQGVNIGAGTNRQFSGLADPATGEKVNPEELYTISGQTRFTRVPSPLPPWQPTEYNVPGTVTENDLRADLNLPARSSHFGALNVIHVARGTSRTVDAVVARYRLPRGNVPAQGVAVILSMLPPALTNQALEQLPPEFQLALPHPSHILMRIRFVDRNPALADQLEGLMVQ